MFLYEFLDVIPPRIIGGDKYSYECYGEHARFLDLERNVDVIFDEKSHEIYEISIRTGFESDDTSLVWRSPAHEEEYLEELKYNRRYSDEDLKTERSNIEDVNDIIEEIKKLYEPGSVL